MKAAAATRPTSGIDRAAAMLGKTAAVAGGRAARPKEWARFEALAADAMGLRP